jgi:SNF2 family DNA or RNA helicase
MKRRRYGALLIDMGLGKTIIALTAIVDMLRSGDIESVLVVAPLRVIQAVWRQEALEWRHTRNLVFSTINGTPVQRVAALKKPAHIYLINPENMRWLTSVLRRRPWPWTMLYVDESTEFSVPKTVRFKALRKGLHHFNRRYIATGTPTPRSLLQLWSQMYLVDRGASLGQTFTEYKKNHFRRTGYMGYQWEPLEGSEETILEAVSRRTVRLAAEDWLSLPDIVTVPVWVELPERARALYDELEAEMFLGFENFTDEGDESVLVESAAALSMKCRQLANGAVYTVNEETGERRWRAIHDAKVNALKELYAEQGEPNMLVPYVFKFDIPRIIQAMPGFKFFSKDKVDVLVREWNTGKLPGLVLSPASSKYGLNMQRGGHHIVWFGPTFSRLQWDQTIGRLRRSGQASDKVFNYVLVARDTADEIAFEAVNRHGIRQQRISDTLRNYYNRRANRNGI